MAASNAARKGFKKWVGKTKKAKRAASAESKRRAKDVVARTQKTTRRVSARPTVHKSPKGGLARTRAASAMRLHRNIKNARKRSVARGRVTASVSRGIARRIS